jgi:hypothetical protein
MKIRKSSIEQAKTDFNDIKNYAIEEAMKQIGNKISPKLDEIINAAMNESVSIEAGAVKIEAPEGEDIKITKDDGSEVTISNGGPKNPGIPGAIDSDEDSDFETVEPSDEDEIEVDMDGDGDDDTEDNEFMVNDEDSDEDETDMNDNSEESEDMADDSKESEDNSDEDEETSETLFEVDDITANTNDTATPIEGPAVEDQDSEQIQDDNMAKETVANPFEIIMQKLDAIETKLGGGTTADNDGQIEIVDDETAEAPQAAAAPDAPVAEEFAINSDIDEEYEFNTESIDEEIVAEIIDEEGLGENDEESLEEILGVSNTVSRQARRRQETEKEIGIRESIQNKKAQHESKIDELNKENESLKETIMEYKKSFIGLRSQFNEMQTFNAKLAYANKIFINGGLSTEEKMKISEQFDKVKTIDEAKELFRNLIKESTSTVSMKKNVEDKIKIKPIAAASSTPAEPLYESEQVKRWKKLGGIIKESDEK